MRHLCLSSVLFGFVLFLACDGGRGDVAAESGGAERSNGGGPAPQPASSSEERYGGEGASDDEADQPVLVTGTYLTCSAVAVARDGEPRESYGCMVALKSTGKQVALEKLATAWTWSEKEAQNGRVTRERTSGAWQILYHLEADTPAMLAALRSAMSVVLSLDLRPSAGGGKAVLEGALERLVLDSEFTPDSDGTGATGSQPGPGGSTFPPPPAPPAPPAGGDNTGDANADGSTADEESAGADPNDGAGEAGTDTFTDDQVLPPVVTFSLVSRSASELDLLAAVNDPTDVSDLRIASSGPVTYLGADFAAGMALLRWSFPVEVSLKKQGLDCQGSGAIGSGSMTISLACP